MIPGRAGSAGSAARRRPDAGPRQSPERADPAVAQRVALVGGRRTARDGRRRARRVRRRASARPRPRADRPDGGDERRPDVGDPGAEDALPRWISGALLSLDTVVLTGLLALTGGASNPFSILYLVHIALAAVVLGRGWTWSLTALAVVCYAHALPRDGPRRDACPRRRGLRPAPAGDVDRVHGGGRPDGLLRRRPRRRRRPARRRDRGDARAGGAQRAPGVADDARGRGGARARQPARHNRRRGEGARARDGPVERPGAGVSRTTRA